MYGESGTLPVPNRGLLGVYDDVVVVAVLVVIVVVVVDVVDVVVSFVVLVVVPVLSVDRGTLGLSSVFKVVSEFSQIRVLESAPSLILQKVSNIFFRSKLHTLCTKHTGTDRQIDRKMHGRTDARTKHPGTHARTHARTTDEKSRTRRTRSTAH